MASFHAPIALVLLLVAGCPPVGAATPPAAASFITTPAGGGGARRPTAAQTAAGRRASSSTTAVVSAPAASRRIAALSGRPVAAASARGRLFSSVVVAASEGAAAAAAAAATATTAKSEQARKRQATKSALLGVFGARLEDASDGGGGSDPVLACPSTLGELTDSVRIYGAAAGPGSLLVSYKASDKMPGVQYKIGPDFVDFAEPPRPAWALSRGESVKEGTFQTPVVPFLYERGWRQSFNANGFPGIEEECRQVTEYFSSLGADGGVVVDLSCGSGLMMRKLVASKRYSRVIGGDLSPTMLAETARRFRQEDLGAPELIRCDVSRLPIKTEVLDGVHAGAALHCWTKLEESLSEVHRVLKPGKGFFATTFLTSASISRPQRADADGFKFFEVDELDNLMRDAGFSDVEVVKSGRACAIVRATKQPNERMS